MEYESSSLRELVKGIPITHVYVAVFVFLTIWFYNFLEFHFIHDVLFTFFRGSRISLTFNPASEIYHGVVANCRLLHSRVSFIHDVLFTFFRGSRISLTFNPASEIYHGVVANCRLLHSRYMATPWLASPHVQTTFLNFHGRAPAVEYTRQIFHASDGGTFALDWLKSSDVLGDSTYEDDHTPIVIVIPGLTSDSSAAVLGQLIDPIQKSTSLFLKVLDRLLNRS
ncbi:embryogenesis-associated protein EMB8 isoform X1 [Tanacetum coccineum]